jgi:hypothetical protein
MPPLQLAPNKPSLYGFFPKNCPMRSPYIGRLARTTPK